MWIAEELEASTNCTISNSADGPANGQLPTDACAPQVVRPTVHDSGPELLGVHPDGEPVLLLLAVRMNGGVLVQLGFQSTAARTRNCT